MSCIPELPYLLALKMCARRFLVLNNSRALLITSSVRRVDPGSNIAHIAVRRSASPRSAGRTHFHADVQRFSCADDGHLLHMTAQCIKETMILKSYQSIFRSLQPSLAPLSRSRRLSLAISGRPVRFPCVSIVCSSPHSSE